VNGYSYLLDRQANAERLKRISLDQFVTARNSGRLIAFVGSYASAHLGYPNWQDMVAQFLERNADMASSTRYRAVFDQLKTYATDRSFAETDLMDLGELLAKIDKHADFKAYVEARTEFAEKFKFKDDDDFPDYPNAAQALFKHLGIVRFMTLNYDLELEWQIFLTENERAAFNKQRRSKGAQTRLQFFEARAVSENSSSHLERSIPGRGRVTSDVVSRENSAKLIEFALWSPTLQSRVLHVHGRADDPGNLLVTRRDYRDRYWRAAYSKLPFEYGMRLIFGGNPILFVGIGAKEDEVMRVLEQFLSDNPNRRAVPMFMIWNSGSDIENAARRLLFNRKFGIHMLFDTEIATIAGDSHYQSKRPTPVDGTADKAYRLIRPLELLGQIADRARTADFWKLGDLRSPQAKYTASLPTTTKFRDSNQYSSYRVDVWRHVRSARAECGPLAVEVAQGAAEIDYALLDAVTSQDGDDAALAAAFDIGKPIKAILGESGYGRGSIAEAIARSYEMRYRDQASGRVIVVNGAFATETDSIFGILSGAFNQFTAQAQGVSRAAATRELFDLLRGPYAPRTPPEPPNADTGLFQDASDQPVALDPGPVTIIINGMERFISHDGSVLSNEVDTLVRLVINGYRQYSQTDSNAQSKEKPPENSRDFPVKLLLIGTQRLSRYMDIVAQNAYDPLRLERAGGKTILSIGPARFSRICNPYFEIVAQSINQTRTGVPIVSVPPAHLEKSSNRRSFFRSIFDSAFPAQRGIHKPILAFEIMRTLAYIGQPSERHVLYHVPSLLTPDVTPVESQQNIDTCLEELRTLGLVLDVDPFPNGVARYGLHKTVVAELRERYGVPMSDSRLANGFNLSLFTAQPVDTYLPEQRWHEEIGKLLDYLIGAYRDDFDPPKEIEAAAKKYRESTILKAKEFSGLEFRNSAHTALARLATPEVADCLRAALSLLRSYYSVPALLMHSNRELDPWMREGPLTEHAERLNRLLRFAQQTAAARRMIAAKLANHKLLGPAPFYPDDLVWLNNELAVVHLTQGSLYEARRALHTASTLNRTFVEPGERHQNWRRIELNKLQADIDRGAIERAEDRIRDIELVLEEQARMFTPDFGPGYDSARGYILANYAKSDLADGRPKRVDPLYPTDFVLTIAITQGYRGLTQHLRGALESAVESFQSALAILLQLNEQRAYAFFMRHLASVQERCSSPEAAERSLRLCVAAAGNARQTDIDHAGRISLVRYGDKRPHLGREPALPKAIPQLSETLRYATTSDMYRLQIEAMQSLAQVHLNNGDSDSALRFATDALAVATRCGFGLRKVSLRILLGRVMAFRNDLDAARELFESASLIGTKLHYEQAVEAAEDERVRIG
jgi:SIR2-like domain